MTTSISPRPNRNRASVIEPLESRITPGSVSFPSVISINREVPAAPDTGVSSVVFRVTFDQNVINVDAADFDVFTSGDAKADATVSVVSVSGSIYDVTVTGVQGNGDLRLDLVDNGSIFNSSEGQLGGPGTQNGSFTGQIYHVLQTMPKVTSITANAPNPTASSSVSWTVTFNEMVTGVDANDFITVPVGLTAPNPPTVTPINPTEGAAASYTVTVTGIVGTGTIGLDLTDDGTIKDLDNNPLQTDPISLAEPTSTETGSGPVAVASGDINGDGKTDLAIVNAFSNSVTVMLGNGDGTFMSSSSFATGSNPRSVAVADVNGDGRPDLVVAASTYSSASFSTVSVLLGNGDGTFQAKQDFGNGFNPLAVAVGDLNGDGRPDIVVTSSTSGGGFVNVLLGNGNGTFQAQQTFSTGSGPVSVAIGDVNGDGKPDVVTANYDDGNVSVLLGNGTGALGPQTTFVTNEAPTSVAIGDLNGDGKPDLAVSGSYYYYDESSYTSFYDGVVSVLLGNGDGTFGTATDYFAGTALTGVALADMNGDGILDVVATDESQQFGIPSESPSAGAAFGGQVFVFRGNGDGTFNGALGFSSNAFGLSGLTIADFNGDGKADVSVVAISSGSSYTLLNNGTGPYTGEVFEVVEPFFDLSITGISDGVTSATPGTMLSFTIDYANLGTIDATGVTITVPLDNNVNFVAGDNPGWVLGMNSVSKTLSGTLAAGATGSELLKLNVKNTISAYSSAIGVTATISDDGTHGEESTYKNNSQSDYDLVTGLSVDLTVSSIADPRFAVPYRTNYFTIHFANLGNWDTAGSALSVTLPANTFINPFASDPRWSSGSSTVTAIVDVPAGGADQTIVLALDFYPPGQTTTPLSTTASINTQYPSDNNSENNTATEQTPIYNGFIVTSPGVAIKKKFAPPIVRVFDRLTGEEVYSITAYESPYRDSIRVAVGDFNFDGVDDIVTTTMKGTGRLRVFDGMTGEMFEDGPLSEEIAVFNGRTEKGAFVAVGNVNGYGVPEIVVGSALGGGTVKVFSLDFQSPDAQPEAIQSIETLQVIKEYRPFGGSFKGGVRVAVGDVDFFGNGNDKALPEGGERPYLEDDIIVGQGFFGAKVKVYKGATDTVLGEFKVGNAGFRGGVSVAVGDINDDGHADLIVGRNTGKPSVVEVFSGRTLLPGVRPTQIGPAINPFDIDPLHPKNTFGVRVAAADVNGDGVADIIASVGIKNDSLVKFYDGAALQGGTVELIENRILTAYSEFPNVALWVAGSRRFSSPA